MARPIMYMIAGPNGAGKSTLYETVISPIVNAPFINADIIQRDELKQTSMEMAYEAAKIAQNRRQECLENKQSFVTESTFSHPSKIELIVDARRKGFRVIFYHVHVSNPDLSVARVSERVSLGGHDVPEEKIRSRYERNQGIIKRAALMSDNAIVYDNSKLNEPPMWVALFEEGLCVSLADSVPRWANDLYRL